MKDSLPKVSFIIPVLHLRRPLNKTRFFMPRYTLRDTLNDLQKNVTLSHEVVVVCNSQDKSLIDFVCSHPHIEKYCLNSVNIGVARSWNMGAEMAEGDILCYLNDDVSIGKQSIENMCELLDNPLVGEVGPAGSYWENLQHQSFVNGDQPIEADVISGFCFLVRASTFRALGGFDVEFSPAGYEEIDFSFRIRQARMKCVACPGVDIKHFHHHGVSSYKINISYLNKTIDSDVLHKRNTDYFMDKWKHGIQSVRDTCYVKK
jgi:GT2 family glycosyltransferase